MLEDLEDSTRYQDDHAVLGGLVRLGIVTDADNDNRIARVKYLDTNKPSGWLPVLINRDVIHYYPYDEDQWTEFETEDLVPQAGETRFVPHRHKLIIKPWMPKVNDQVLVLYLPVRDGDGFILGGIQPWR